MKTEVETVVYAGTDKAGSPTNTMSAAQFSRGISKTKFVFVRSNNFLITRGSVPPLFAEQQKSCIDSHGARNATLCNE